MILHGLTNEQCKLLDKMWGIETVDELEQWMRTLPKESVKEVIVLRELLCLSLIDEQIEEAKDTTLALEMIEKCR